MTTMFAQVQSRVLGSSPVRYLLFATLLASVSCDGGNDLGQPPTALLTAPSFCDIGAVITLDGRSSTDPNGDIALYCFTIADGTAVREVTSKTVDHVCRVTGLIEVALAVHDAMGNVGRTSAVVSVRPP